MKLRQNIQSWNIGLDLRLELCLCLWDRARVATSSTPRRILGDVKSLCLVRVLEAWYNLVKCSPKLLPVFLFSHLNSSKASLYFSDCWGCCPMASEKQIEALESLLESGEAS